MKVLLATPLHSGTADREFINGLLECHGLYASWACLEGQANISRARDQLAASFLAGDCDSLVFIDGDIGFRRADLEHLLASPFPVTGGLYPRKTAQKPFVCAPQPELAPIVPGHEDYRLVKRVGTGFLRIDRSAFETLIQKNMALAYPLDGARLHQFFPSGVLDGVFLSEDYFFCELLVRAGIAIHIDTRVRLRHVGRVIFTP
jgi:hypothetical protein